MAMLTKVKKRSKNYYLRNSIEPMPINGRNVCPWCKKEPEDIVLYLANLGVVTFLKRCNSCGSYIKIEKKSSDI